MTSLVTTTSQQDAERIRIPLTDAPGSMTVLGLPR